MALLDLASRVVGLMALIAIAIGSMERATLPRYWRAMGQGAAFGGAAAICMLFPVLLADGTSVNGRSLFLAFAAAFGGWAPWAIAALLTTSLHLVNNDASVLQLVAPMLTAGALGLSWRWVIAKRFGLNTLALLGLGVWVSLISLLLLVLSTSGDSSVLFVTYPTILAVCLAASLVLGSFIQRELRHFSDEQSWKNDAFSDALTGIANKRAFQADYQRALDAQVRFCLIVVDIDHFKKVNDTFGHQVGDEVLKSVGSILSKALPLSAAPYRLGGEEFAILARGFDINEGMQLAERLRIAISRATGEPSALPQITVSAGLAASGPGIDCFEPMSAADAALYAAKAAGRDRVLKWEFDTNASKLGLASTKA
ncbi:GGDEF domain-containing protein [Rhizobium sp. S163]|uniref:GGDEF domain-containing protein n=1 Tax=Rhizobium sp. S163 TaxID=3055039 RepID=UPI0025A99FF9|nr:GGDEF domain-containing protein [Rhizobium sp. S163]MDM9645512.1 GGDEF domain-containing protein [Rhizobium sp. S163]